MQKKNCVKVTCYKKQKKYRQIPHSATGAPPASMMFCDAVKSIFFSRVVSDEEVIKAKAEDSK